MLIAMLATVVALGAFCIWLTVRIINRHERWAKWTAAGFAAVVLAAGVAIWWWTVAEDGIIYDPIDMRADFPSTR